MSAGATLMQICYPTNNNQSSGESDASRWRAAAVDGVLLGVRTPFIVSDDKKHGEKIRAKQHQQVIIAAAIFTARYKGHQHVVH